MRTIHKHSIALDVETELSLPVDSIIVDFQVQHGAPTLWVLGDANAAKAPRKVKAFDSGEEIPDGWVYIGTSQVYAGDLVFHLFAEPNGVQK